MIHSDRAERLAEYLAGVGADARFWPNDHCLLYLARWAGIVRPDFDASVYECRVAGRVSAHRLLLASGGVEPLLNAQATAAGFERVDAAGAGLGAIGLIRVPRVERPGHMTFGCIRTPRRWAIRSHDGVVSLSADTIKVQPHMVWNV
ncbi:hypothetical protein GCM10008171_33090 [Methylopila jiangsuensis]|uniref:Uncharacterized protein n=1 Tax=Methylopila jiangsuensis TaxID=586230 RepID=A0A9W6N554_9HYPH|nr:hypothetical protein [Methylopila jiangsuensis]MDR6284557.1 hypothetical protein [Methylopila jiangsuensis]GLK78055.1 hypothetical protein GCM10008171_33090 [Methylopila jiangsuensis]